MLYHCFSNGWYTSYELNLHYIKKKKQKTTASLCSGLSMVLYPALFVNTRAHLQILHHTLQQQKVSLG